MVWEQEVIVVAMVTLEREGGKVNNQSSSIEESMLVSPGKTRMSPFFVILTLSNSKLSRNMVSIRLSCFPLKNLEPVERILFALNTLILRANLYLVFTFFR